MDEITHLSSDPVPDRQLRSGMEQHFSEATC